MQFYGFIFNWRWTVFNLSLFEVHLYTILIKLKICKKLNTQIMYGFNMSVYPFSGSESYLLDILLKIILKFLIIFSKIRKNYWDTAKTRKNYFLINSIINNSLKYLFLFYTTFTYVYWSCRKNIIIFFIFEKLTIEF